MKVVISAVLALSVLAGYAASAAAAETGSKAFWEQLDRDSRGGRTT
jgi:hypothetical protein